MRFKVILVLIELFKEYQTFIAGILGFIGVIWTLEVNARNEEKNRNASAKNQRDALRLCLIQELELIKSSYIAVIEGLSDPKESAPVTYMPERVHAEVYRQLLNQFGLLSVCEVQKTMIAYQLVLELPERLRFLESLNENYFRTGYIPVESDVYRAVVDIHDSFLSSIMEAIDVLEAAQKTS
ncbi:conserved hypothetical protein [Vibrio crassostreae]|nr:conserved hypothetical protein [Vibrio crassostreae]CAK2055848.1 conserved hypothetical protein [Vibrio crassostreae]CAK2057667.1 conserved hypothetical protein [Vibrio crassostreae]CAK2061668.1 conserved hypothetical protein [Vibrio crassostreae]CAK2062553.1 conserved hypothetical protein [Vibrio crassostreae]